MQKMKALLLLFSYGFIFVSSIVATASINGRLFDVQTGQPINGGSIIMFEDYSVNLIGYPLTGRNATSVVADSLGYFQFDDLGFWTQTVSFTAYAQGYALLPFVTDTFDTAPSTTLNLYLEPYSFETVTKGVKVYVKDRLSGQNISGIQVEIQYPGETIRTSGMKLVYDTLWQTAIAQKTNGSGLASFISAVPGNNLLLKVSSSGHATKLLLIGAIDTTRLTEYTIFIDPVRATVAGHVSDNKTGNPINQAKIELRQLVFRPSDSLNPVGYYVRDTVSTDSNGAYMFSGLAAATQYRLVASSSDCNDDSAEVDVPAYTGTPIVLPKTNMTLTSCFGDINGRVMAFHGNRPIANAVAYLKSVNFKRVGDIYVIRDTILDSVVTGNDGYFFFGHRNNERFLFITASCELYKTTEPYEINVSGGDTVFVTVPIWIESGIIGNVTDSVSGRGLSGAKVEVFALQYRFENGKFQTVRVSVDTLTTDSTALFASPQYLTGGFIRGYEISVSADGYITKTLTGITIDSASPEYGANIEMCPVHVKSDESPRTGYVQAKVVRHGKWLTVVSEAQGLVVIYNIYGQQLWKGKTNTIVSTQHILANNQMLFVSVKINGMKTAVMKTLLSE
jgi:hypothetical protein